MPTVGSWIWNVLTNEEQWSDSAYDLFGYKPRAIQPTYDTFKSALHPEDRARVLAAVSATLSQGSTYRVGCRIIRPDGDVLYVVCAGDVVRDADGRVVTMAGTVAVRKRTEMVAIPPDLHAAAASVALRSGKPLADLIRLAVVEKYGKAG